MIDSSRNSRSPEKAAKNAEDMKLEKSVKSIKLARGAKGMKSELGICAAALLISLLMLLLTSFAAFTYSTANGKMNDSREKMKYSQNYYAAESTASEIIGDFYEEKQQVSASLNGREEQETLQGTIEVKKIDGIIYFSVPIDNSSNLTVEAKVSKNGIEIVEWYVE